MLSSTDKTAQTEGEEKSTPVTSTENPVGSRKKESVSNSRDLRARSLPAFHPSMNTTVSDQVGPDICFFKATVTK